MRLQTCVGSGDTSLMYHGRECARLGSTTRQVSFYVSLVGGGLRLSGPSSGNKACYRSMSTTGDPVQSGHRTVPDHHFTG